MPPTSETTAAPAAEAVQDASSGLPEAVRASLDADIAAVRDGSRAWSHLTIGQRARLLERVRATVVSVAAEWAELAADSKGLPAGHPLRGEEWLAGPYAVLTAIDALTASLHKLERGESPLSKVKASRAPGGRVRFSTFPATPIDGLLLSGFTGEVWLTPGVTEHEARSRAGLGQLDPTTPGGVGLVLGAGNISAIPVEDVFYELFAYNRVAILKINPTMDSLLSVFKQALAPLIEPGFLRITTGAGDVGAYLTTHPAIDHVHITGAEATFDAIVWGTGAAAKRRKREGRPLLKKPITAELGGVAPIIVVPGEWSEADLRFQAEHVVTMRLQNSGHNCIAGQVVIVSSDWPQREAFIAAVDEAYRTAPERPVWYPRSDAKLAAAAADYPAAKWVAGGTRALVMIEDPADAAALQSTEYFCPVLGVIALPGLGQEFLDAAVAHSNDELAGSLGANVLIDPAAEKALGNGFERAIGDLRYGGIAINAWTAFSFLTPTVTWGAFPGNPLESIGSGTGVVHNALLIADTERSVVRGPFRPFPRGAGSTVLPKPPWFVTSRTGAQVSEGFTRFKMTGSWAGLTRTLLAAFRA